MSKNLSTFDITMEYQTLSKTKAKELKGLASKKERDKAGLFIAEGEKCVVDLLAAFPPAHLIASKDWLEANIEVIKPHRSKILVTDRRGLEIVSSLHSVPDVMAVFEKPAFESAVPKLSPRRLYILLDEIQDPGNLGTIIRTADWFGVYEIFASPNSVDVFSPKVVQATMGSLARVKVRYCDLHSLIDSNPGLPVIGALLEGVPLKESNLKPEGFLLMGNEGRGISPQLRKLIDCPVTIPPVNPSSHPDSLNVAIATAILLSSLTSS